MVSLPRRHGLAHGSRHGAPRATRRSAKPAPARRGIGLAVVGGWTASGVGRSIGYSHAGDVSSNPYGTLARTPRAARTMTGRRRLRLRYARAAMPRATATPIDRYLAEVPPSRRAMLAKLRATIRSIVPDAEECISYRMPAFRVDGRIVAGFRATATGGSYLPVQRHDVADAGARRRDVRPHEERAALHPRQAAAGGARAGADRRAARRGACDYADVFAYQLFTPAWSRTASCTRISFG